MKTSASKSVVSGLALVLGLTLGSSAEAAPASTARVARGAAFVQAHCSVCHAVGPTGASAYPRVVDGTAVLAESLGMHVAFYDVVTKLPLGNARQVGSLHALLAQSDIVTLHVPETPATKWLIGQAELVTGATRQGNRTAACAWDCYNIRHVTLRPRSLSTPCGGHSIPE